MISARQIRAARALLGWSQLQLADKAVLSKNAVQRLEGGNSDARSSTTNAVETALKAAGIEFINAASHEGVQLQTNRSKKGA